MKLKSLKKVKLHSLSVLYGSPGSGKAEWVENIIYTPTGRRRFGDLKKGDYVFDRTGKPTKVLDTFPQGELEAYKVTLTDGREVICNDEHLWTVVTFAGNYKTIPLKEIIAQGVRKPYKRGYTEARFYIPAHDYAQFEAQPTKVDPYVMGAFIGNGSLTSLRLTLSSADTYVVHKVADKLGAEAVQRTEGSTNYNFKKNGKFLRTADVLSEVEGLKKEFKFIPDSYLYNSVEARRELLRGLFDTDARLEDNKQRLRINYSTKSGELGLNITTLVRSLGYKVKDVTLKNASKTSLAISVPTHELPSLFTTAKLKVKANSAKDNHEHRPFKRVAITKVEKMERKVEMMCIKVDNPEHLYLSNEFVVTHNTYAVNSLPNKTLIIDTDRGLASLSPDERFAVAECYSWEDVQEAIKLAKDFDSIAVDHMTNVQELCYKSIMDKYNVTTMQIQHYGEAIPQLKAFVDDLVALSYEGKNVMVLCQETSINIEEEQGDEVPKQVVPNLAPSLRSYLQASARVILHTQKELKKSFDKGKKITEEVHCVQVSGNPIYTTKVTRKPGTELPKKVKDITWDKITRLVEGVTDKKETKAEKGDK